MKSSILLFFVFTSFFINAASNKTFLNSSGLTIDSAKNMVNDKNISFPEKCNCLLSINNFLPCTELENEFLTVINNSGEEIHEGIKSQLYCMLVYTYMVNQNFSKAHEYLTNALQYEDKIGKPFDFFFLYNCAGTYYTYINNELLAHEYLYKAIEFAEKIPGKEEVIISMLYNISISYINKEDLVTLRQNIEKIHHYASKVNTSAAKIFTNHAMVSYYKIKLRLNAYENDFHKNQLIDSIQTFSTKAIDAYENMDGNNFTATWNNIIRSCYWNIANSESEREQPDWNKTLVYLEKSELFRGIDPLEEFNNKVLKIKIKNNLGNYQEAIEECLNALEMAHVMEEDSLSKERYYSSLNAFYNQLSSSYGYTGDFKKAYQYKVKEEEYLKMVYKQETYNSIKEIETKYDIKTKEQEIEVLKKDKEYEQRVRYLFSGIIVLIIALAIIIIHISQVKRKSALKDMKIMKVKEEETQLQMKLKEEQLKNAELEKYEALLDAHFKELEIYGKNSELEELKEDKQKLDYAIRIYTEKLKHYEYDIEIKHGGSKRLTAQPILEELSLLFDKKLGVDSMPYKEKLKQINDLFIAQLEEASHSSISTMYLKYCMCFAINMEAKEIAECFSIEQNSVHMIRYRVKKKLNLSNKEDLNNFLINVLNTTLPKLVPV